MSELGVRSIGPYAVGLLVAVVLIAIGALILTTMQPATYQDLTVVSEYHNSTGTVPEEVVLTHCDNGITGTPVVDMRDYEQATVTRMGLTTANANYTVLSTVTCTFNITSARYINATADTYWFNYTYKSDTNASTVMRKGVLAMSAFGDWFSIIVIVIVAVIVISFIMVLGKQRGRD